MLAVFHRALVVGWSHRMNKLTTVLCLGAVVGIAGCAGDEKEAATPATLAPTASTAPAPVAPAPAPTPTPAPAASTAPLAAIEPALAQFAQGVLAQAGTEEAPGAKGLDMPKVALLAPGQTSELTVTMQPGKCYTVVAIGLPPLSELNVQLLPTTLGFNTVLAQDQTTGPRAVLGKAPDCYKLPLPVPGAVRVVTTAAVGQGLAATQVFEK
jgi:hypothetical protein